MSNLTLEAVHALAKRALMGSGAGDHAATIMADSVRDAEADGIQAVGLGYLPFYCRHVKIGRVLGEVDAVVSRPRPGTIFVDAAHGYCHPAYVAGEGALIDAARENGIAMMGITNSHASGVLGWYADRLAQQGLVAFAFTNASAMLAPAGGTKPLFGTNPIAFAVPRTDGRPPMVIDQSATATARVNLVVKMEAGEKIPMHWGLDANGNPTDDPAVALNEGSIAPAGGYKGAALALIVELMSAALTGALYSHETASLGGDEGGFQDIGQSFIAIDPSTMPHGKLGFAERAETLFDAMLEQDGVRLPSSNRVAHRAKAEAEGVAVPDDLIKLLERYAEGELPA